MYICICNEVTDRAIVQAAENGANTLKDLNKSLNVANQCGRCASCARALLKEAKTAKYPLCLQVA